MGCEGAMKDCQQGRSWGLGMEANRGWVPEERLVNEHREKGGARQSQGR